MAIKGKKMYKVYLDEEATEYVKSFLDSRRGGGGLSAVLDTVVVNLAYTLKKSGVKDGSNLSWAKLIRMVLIGLTKN